jgi:hypothetical protein
LHDCAALTAIRLQVLMAAGLSRSRFAARVIDPGNDFSVFPVAVFFPEICCCHLV